ncbi:hypothetical protein OGM63_02220 [Plectonema radiosum NIES-515]|uniref:Uncharacterized protein n=1 Tax=Plectonema radiosum NIES-515 TaxID=2986073 RepID=A0ABT3AUE0_9CYAN|nr:hypothetical protein [Plectonema radiosum]MCV3212355.1 hypothetical protein [Plectonema radiosum NIES-515]
MPGSPPELLVFGNFHSFRERRLTLVPTIEEPLTTVGALAETSDKLFSGEPA